MNAEKLKKLITNAENHRTNIGWDKQAEEAIKVKDNKIPVYPKKQGEHYYKDNWILKAINWIVSMLSGADINVTLQSITGIYEKKMQLMDCEVNFFMDFFNWTEHAEKALYDRYFLGIGVIKHIWNPYKIDSDFQTGKIEFQHKDSRNIYLDPHPDKCFYIIEKIQLDTEDLFNYYPEYEKLNNIKNESVTVYIVQHKKVIKVKTIGIYNQLTDETKFFDYKEYEELLNEINELPEGLTASEPFLIEKDEVTEFVYLADEHKILDKKIIGDDFTYHILKGFQISDSSYSFGLPYYLLDQQEISIILMTISLLSALKYHKPTKITHPEAIENYDEIKDTLHMPGVEIRINPEWRERNPGVKPIEYIDPPKFNNELDYLERKIQEVIKSTSGVTDTLQGQAQYAGISGVAVSQFQNQAKVFHKKDFIQWERFIIKNVHGLMRQISKFRNYNHKILGLSESGANELLEVAINDDTTLDKYNYIVQVNIDENNDAIRQMEQDLILKLYQMDIVTEEDVLYKMPFKDKDTMIENMSNRKKEMAMQQQQQQMTQGGQDVDSVQ